MTQCKQKNGPIFIVGAPRSGTTLLQYILRSHPRISMPTAESHFMIPLYRNANKFGDLRRIENVRRVLQEMYRISANFLDTDLHGIKFNIETLAKDLCEKDCNTIPEIIRGLFEKNARGEGKERWGDKTPYYVLHMKAIIEMFPDAKIIHIIRDGRDCVLSMFRRKLKIYNTYHAAKLWQQYVETGQEVGKELGPDAYLKVRYEDLLSDAITTLHKICGFLGVDYSDSLINFEKARGPKKTLLQKPIQKDNMEKWRRLMPPRQVSIFERAVGETLVRNGYTLTTTAKPLPLPLRVVYRFHIKIASWHNSKFNTSRR